VAAVNVGSDQGDTYNGVYYEVDNYYQERCIGGAQQSTIESIGILDFRP
jgi:hypothetical protein